MNTIDTIIVSPDSVGLPSRATVAGRITVATVAFAAWIERLLANRRSRLALMEMSDDQLKDIGLSRADACREGLRPFWD